MLETYVRLALLISVIEVALVAYRLRAASARGRTLFYAVGSGLLTFILLMGLAQSVWGVVLLNAGQPGGGAGGPNREFTLNVTTLVAGALLIMVTGVVTASATLAGVQVGRGLSAPSGDRSLQPVMLPTEVAGVSLARLRQTLTERLDANELNNLAFDLGVDLDSLPPASASGRVRELLEYWHRRGELERVVAWVRGQRPDIGL